MEKSVMSRRLSLFPIKDDEVWSNFYKKAQACHWTAEEIDLGEDLKSFKRMSNGEKRFVKFVLAFFNGADVVVNANISANFLNDFDTPEINAFYWLQGAMEVIHSETYSLLIDTYFTDKEEKEKAFNAITGDEYPTIKAKAEWVTKYMNRERSLVERLFGFALVEGLQFSGSFCAIFWLKKRNLCPGLTFSNELISRDEALHTEFSCLMFKRENAKAETPFSQEDAYRVTKECVEIEKKFVNESLKIALIGMNSKMMGQYIERVADVILGLAGFEPLYNAKNPFDFMEMINLEGKTNFFEKRVGEYQKANIGQTKEQMEFSMDCDF